MCAPRAGDAAGIADLLAGGPRQIRWRLFRSPDMHDERQTAICVHAIRGRIFIAPAPAYLPLGSGQLFREHRWTPAGVISTGVQTGGIHQAGVAGQRTRRYPGCHLAA